MSDRLLRTSRTNSAERRTTRLWGSGRVSEVVSWEKFQVRPGESNILCCYEIRQSRVVASSQDNGCNIQVFHQTIFSGWFSKYILKVDWNLGIHHFYVLGFSWWIFEQTEQRILQSISLTQRSDVGWPCPAVFTTIFQQIFHYLINFCVWVVPYAEEQRETVLVHFSFNR